MALDNGFSGSQCNPFLKTCNSTDWLDFCILQFDKLHCSMLLKNGISSSLIGFIVIIPLL